MFCCMLLYVHSSIAIILMGKRELIALLNLSSWCLVMVERLFLAVPRGCLQFVIVFFPDHTHLLFLHRKILVELKIFNYILMNLTLFSRSYKHFEMSSFYQNRVSHVSFEPNNGFYLQFMYLLLQNEELKILWLP